jgi:NAD(P)-dependent dehydrogenase (short-subunit alcohol dehydrogenase family)
MPGLDEFSLDGKVAIVTGSGQGIGKGIALALARAGADVAVAGITLADRSRDLADLDATVSAIKALERRSIAIPTDARSADDVKTLIDQTIAEFGRLDVMVNNAGGGFAAHFMDINERGFEAIVRNNLKSTYLCCQAAGRVMLESGSGAIINLASGAGMGPSPTQPVYGATKAGIINLTESLAVEFGPTVRVNAIAPGLTATEGLRARYDDDADAEIRRQGERYVAGRLATPEDMGLAAVFLASDAAQYVSGITLRVDGGGRAMEE